MPTPNTTPDPPSPPGPTPEPPEGQFVSEIGRQLGLGVKFQPAPIAFTFRRGEVRNPVDGSTATVHVLQIDHPVGIFALQLTTEQLRHFGMECVKAATGGLEIATAPIPPGPSSPLRA